MILTMLKKYKIELILFAIAVIVRFGYAIALQIGFGSHVFISFSDAATYLKIAQNFLQYHTFSQALNTPNLLPDALRTPLFPLFLSIFEYFKLPLLIVALVQNILVGIMVILTYRLGIKIFESRIVGIIAGLLFCFEPMSIYWNNLLMSDTLASFLFIFSIYYFVSQKYYWSALMFGLAALARPTFFYLSPVLFFMYIFFHYNVLFKKKYDTAPRVAFWKKFVIMCSIFFIIIFPWMLRNKIQFNNWGLSSNGWLAIHYFSSNKFAQMMNVPYWWPSVDLNYYAGSDREVLYRSDFLATPFFKNYFFGLVSRYPWEYIRFHTVSAIKGFDNHDYGYIINHVLLPEVPHFNKTLADLLIMLGQGMWYVFYGFLIYGFFIRGRRAWQFFLMSFFVANNFLTGYASMGSGAGRYGLPFLPLTLLLVSYGFLCFYKYIKNKLSERIMTL